MTTTEWLIDAPDPHHPDTARYRPLPPHADDVIPRAAVLPLLKGYLRLGAVFCGPAAQHVDLGTADFLVLLDLAVVDQRYLRFFLGDHGSGTTR